jgi:hypothetical protein
MNAWIVVVTVILRAATTAHRRETIRIQIKGQTLIQLTVAVVVNAVANLRGTRLDARIIVVTVRARSRQTTSRNTVEAAAGAVCGAADIAVLVPVAIVRRLSANAALVNLTVAVVIKAVADLSHARVNIRVVVIAVILRACATV